MGMFICEICNEQMTPPSHTCNIENIRQNVRRLDIEARTAEKRLSDVCNAVYKVLQPLPSLENKTVEVETEWLRKLWNAAQCQWWEAKTADDFLTNWIATHRILCRSFNLFRSKKQGTAKDLLDKLTALKEACEGAKRVLGYQDSRLDLSPDDLIKEMK